MKHPGWVLVVVAAGALAAAAGCHSRRSYTLADRYEEGLVVCLSGAGGMMGETERIRAGLDAGGVRRAIEIFEWSRGGVLEDQTGIEANRRKAAQLARRVEGYLQSYPGRPVHLVGVSAGTGLVVWALESLEKDVTVTGAVLISSSLDTKYDLTAALQKVTDHLYSFNSVADTVLSLGVTWAGTVDRKGGLAAGLVGFSPPDSASAETKALYKERLSEISWWPGDVVLGHVGDHLGATSQGYVKAKIAPLILGKGLPKQPAATNHQAVQTNGPRTKEYAERLARQRQAQEEQKAAQPPQPPTPEEADKADIAKHAQEAQRDLKAQRQGKPVTGTQATGADGRFVNWNVGRDAPPQELRREDQERFFSDLRRWP